MSQFLLQIKEVISDVKQRLMLHFLGVESFSYGSVYGYISAYNVSKMQTMQNKLLILILNLDFELELMPCI